MDSSKNLDSTVSLHSCANDDVHYLSVEEKACLMFLEEAIESQDKEEGNSLSDDEPKNPPVQKNRPSKSINPKDPTWHCSDPNQIRNYLVPTPFVLANCSPDILAKPFREKTLPNQDDKSESGAVCQYDPAEDNVLICPAFTSKISDRNSLGLHDDQSSDCGSSQGPLFGGGLLKICTSASRRNSFEAEKQQSTHEDLANNTYKGPETKNSSGAKPNPLFVATKTKIIPPCNNNTIIQSPFTRYRSIGPEGVRLEALSKLGLLKEENLTTNKHQIIPEISSDFDDNCKCTLLTQNLETGVGLRQAATTHLSLDITQTSGQSSSDSPVTQKPSSASGSSVQMVPNMEEEHREALIKLGLLKK